MITVYQSTETNFNNNGLCVLSNCKTALVAEEINAMYELELVHPVDSRNKWQYLVEGNIIKADEQLFRIYRKIKTTDGLSIKLNARHIFYDLLDNFIETLTVSNGTAAQAAQAILTNTQYPSGFTALSTISGLNSVTLLNVNPVEAFLGATGIASIYNGEIYRDNFSIELQARRGADRGVLITYGKNLEAIEEDLDIDAVITRIYPIGQDGLTLPEKYIDTPNINAYPNPKIKTVQFDSTTESDLRSAAIDYANSGIDTPKVNYRVNFVELSRTEQYKDYALLERVYLGDTVTIRHSKLGIDINARVIKYKKDAITGRYLEIELGNFKDTAFETTNALIKGVTTVTTESKSYTEQLVAEATQEINSALGGYVLKRESELLIMDTQDPNTAQSLWRWNVNGLGYSSTGYNGPYETAITSDGKIVADFIAAGELFGGIIKAGTVAIGAVNSEFGNLLDISANNTITSLAQDVSDNYSLIQQNSQQISLKVSKDSVISEINQTAEIIKISASKVDLQGIVTVTDLATAGQTTINGSNITTGFISANRISGGTITGITISGNTITGGIVTGATVYGNTITGNTISGGTISGTTITGGTITGSELKVGDIGKVHIANFASGGVIELLKMDNTFRTRFWYNQDIDVSEIYSDSKLRLYSVQDVEIESVNDVFIEASGALKLYTYGGGIIFNSLPRLTNGDYLATRGDIPDVVSGSGLKLINGYIAIDETMVCQSGASQQLKFQVYNGYLEIYINGSYFGKCDII